MFHVRMGNPSISWGSSLFDARLVSRSRVLGIGRFGRMTICSTRGEDVRQDSLLCDQLDRALDLRVIVSKALNESDGEYLHQA